MVPLCVRGVASPPVETGAGGDDRGEQGDVAVAPDQPALPVDVQDLRRRNGEVGPPHPDGQPDAGGPEEHDVGAAPADLLGRRERRHRADDAFTEGDDGEEDGDPQKGRREVEGQEGEDDSTRLRKNDCRGVGSARGASLRRLARGPQPLGRYRTHHDIAEHHDLAVDLATRDDRRCPVARAPRTPRERAATRACPTATTKVRCTGAHRADRSSGRHQTSHRQLSSPGRRLQGRPGRQRGPGHPGRAVAGAGCQVDHHRRDGRDGGVQPGQYRLRRRGRPGQPWAVPAARLVGNPRAANESNDFVDVLLQGADCGARLPLARADHRRTQDTAQRRPLPLHPVLGPGRADGRYFDGRPLAAWEAARQRTHQRMRRRRPRGSSAFR